MHLSDMLCALLEDIEDVLHGLLVVMQFIVQ